VILGIQFVESIEAPAAASAPAGDPHADVLELRLGRIMTEDEIAQRLETARAPSPGDPSPAALDAADYHIVQAGETLSSIAQQRLGSALMAAELARINGLADPNKIEVGQVLYLR
jgi:LysM repeat protein